MTPFPRLGFLAKTHVESAPWPRWFRASATLGLVLALILVLVSLAVAWRQSELHHQELKQRLAALLDVGQSEVQAWTSARLHRLQTWASDPGLAALAQSSPEPEGSAGGQPAFPGLAAARADWPDLAEAALVSPRSRNLAALDPRLVGAVSPLVDQGDLLAQVFAGRALIAPLQPAASSVPDQGVPPRLVLAAPVKDGGGRVLAALVALCDLKAGGPGPLGCWQLGPGESLLALDGRGRVIASTLAGDQPGQASGLAAALQSDRLTEFSSAGQRRLVMGRWLPDLGLGVAVTSDAVPALRPLTTIHRIIAAGASLTLAMLLLLWLWLFRCLGQASRIQSEAARTSQRLSEEVDRCQLAEEALTSSRRRYQTLLDNATDMFIAADISREDGPGAIVEVNQAACRILGYRREELLGMRALSLVQPQLDLAEPLARLWREGSLSTETRLLTKDGRVVPVEAVVHLMELEGRQVVMTQLRDITDRLQAQRELREREASLQAIVDGFEGFVYICSADNRLEFVNERLRRHLGRDPVGELCHQAVHGSPVPCRWCADGTVVGGRTVRREVFNPNDQRWYYSVLSPLVHPDGRVSKHGIMLDITSREQARRDLAAQEELLRSVLGSLPAHIAVLNPAGIIIAVNQAWEDFGRAGGAKAGQVGVGVNYLQVVSQAAVEEQTAAQALEGIRAVLEGRRDSFQQEYACHAPDGSQHWFLMTVSPLERSRGGVVISHMEVTERVRAEQAMRESRARYRNLAAQLPLAVAIVQQGRIVFANPQAASVFGLPEPGALLGADPLDHVAPGERARMAEILDSLSGTDAAATRQEVMLRRVDGVEFPAEIHGARLDYGDRPAVQLVINDITERRQTQETIGVLARILEESPNPVLRVTSQGQLLYANPTAQKLLASWGL